MSIRYYPRPALLSQTEGNNAHAVIEASAGTGKTFTIEHLVVDLIISGKADIEKILVVTFTDAATRELRERIRSLIRRICDESLPAPPSGRSSGYWEVDEGVRNNLRNALFCFDAAPISTIHGFCLNILSEQAFLSGRLYKEEHIDGSELFGQTFREEFRKLIAEESETGEELRRWIESGKSPDTLSEILYKCHSEGFPDRCKITPFPDHEGFRKALISLPCRTEIENSASSLFSHARTRKTFNDNVIGLYDMLEIIKESPDYLSASGHFIETAFKKCTVSGHNMALINQFYRLSKMPDTPESLRSLASLLDLMALRAINPESFFAFKMLPAIQKRLAAKKVSLGLLDFDDMLSGVHEALFGKGSNSAALLEALRKRFSCALVDEFQDTDRVQWEIFHKIFVDGTKDHRLFVIGDPKQAIYGFRGADVHTYKVAADLLKKKHGALSLELPSNYRSTELLTDALNDFFTFTQADGSRFFSGLNSYERPVKCGNPGSYVIEGGNKSAPVHLLHICSADKLNAGAIRNGLYHFFAKEIIRLMRSDRFEKVYPDKRVKPLALSDIFILARSRKEAFDAGGILRKYGIPHSFYKQEGLLQTREADDVYKLLRAIETPTHPARYLNALLSPFFNVPLSDLHLWTGTGSAHESLLSLSNWNRMANDRAWAAMFEDILNSTGIIRRLVCEEDERRITNYLHLFEILLSFTHESPLTLSQLASKLKSGIDGRTSPLGRNGDVQRLETERDSVKILTMHKAKGLEAEVIFITGGLTDPKSDPPNVYHDNHSRKLHTDKDASGIINELIKNERNEEDQRLFYVALTRAGSRVYIPFFNNPETTNDKKETRFYQYSRMGKFQEYVQKHLNGMYDKKVFDDKSKYLIRELVCDERGNEIKSFHFDKTLNIDEPKTGIPEAGQPPSASGKAALLAEKHRALLMTSYTRISRGKAFIPYSDDNSNEERRSEEISGEVNAETLYAGTESRTDREKNHEIIPGGKKTGIFLHDLLENTAPGEVHKTDYDNWSTLEEVDQRFSSTALKYGLMEYQKAAMKIVHNALTIPLRLQSIESPFFDADNSNPDDKTEFPSMKKAQKNDGGYLLNIPEGIASADKFRHEMPFMFPIPESFHPLLSSDSSAGKQDRSYAFSNDRIAPYEAVRGYIKGLIDLVFEHEGQIFILDWKSDLLPSFRTQNINRHVAKNYTLQAGIYSTAVIRFLNISSEEIYEKKFGGIIYAFIRGMKTDEFGNSQGLWYSRPSWAEMVRMERGLLMRNQWGGPVIPVESFISKSGKECEISCAIENQGPQNNPDESGEK